MGDIYIMTLLNLLLTKTNVRHRYQNIIHYSMCLFLYIHQDTNTYIYLGRLNELPTSPGINAPFYLHRLKLITFFIVFYYVDKRLLICIGNRADKWKSLPILYLLTVVKLVRIHFFSQNNFRNKIPFQLVVHILILIFPKQINASFLPKMIATKLTILEHTCLKSKFGSTLMPNKVLYLILILQTKCQQVRKDILNPQPILVSK